jgi:hypothetical protein
MQTKIYNQTNSHVVFDISKLCTLLSSTTFSFTFLSNPQMMAHTRDTDTQLARQPDNSNVLPKPKRTTRTTAKSKTSHTANDTSTVESEQCAPAKNGKPSDGMPKRQRDVDATAAAEEKQAAPTKKPRTAPKQAKDKPDVSTRRSGRAQTKAPAAPQRRKRRTPEEMAADKAKAEAKKRQQEELTQQNHRTMAQMDIDEDIDRAETAAQTVRTFADLNHDTESGVEEFVGYNSVSGSDDSDPGSDGHPEVPLQLEVRLLHQFRYSSVLTSYNRKPRKCPQKRR